MERGGERSSVRKIMEQLKLNRTQSFYVHKAQISVVVKVKRRRLSLDELLLLLVALMVALLLLLL